VRRRRRLPVVPASLCAVAAAALASCAVLVGPGVRAAAAEGGGRAYLVTLQPASDGRAAALFATAGVHPAERLWPLSVYRVTLDDGQEPAPALEAIRASPFVRAAEPDDEQRVQVIPNDPLYHAFQWNLQRIRMEQAWDVRPSASDVIVAVLDTGVDFSHPDLRANLLDGGYDFINDSPTPQDDESHGTAVAGIIGAVGNNNEGVAGIAWHVKILPIKALNNLGRGPDSAMVKAILYAADNGARVINISSTGSRYSAALQTAVSYAQEKGALVVAAAGNTGDQDNPVSYPAALDGVLAVAAVDDQDGLAPFSQRGPYVSLAAPGVEVPSTAWAGAGRGPYASQSGTSIAAPHVSGVAALLWEMRPDLGAADIAATLQGTADPVGRPGSDAGVGAGVVDAARAVAALRLGVLPRARDSTSLRPATPATAQLPAPTPLPAEGRRWYFAEGSTKPPFQVAFALLNPNPRPATVTFIFLSPEGKQTPYEMHVGPNSRTTLAVNDVLPNAEFGTIVQTDIPVYVERTMYFGHDGHSTTGARQPSRAWYLAEGSTAPPFDTWVLMMNPNGTPTSVKLTFMREDGTVSDRTEVVSAWGRRSVYVNPLFSAAGFSTQVQSEQPIVVERAMYFDAGRGGDDAMGTATPARSWFLAAGSSRNGFDTWLLVHNPDSAPASATVSFMTETGAVVTQPMFVPPHGRASLYTDPLLPDSGYGMRVDSDRPIVVERSIYFANGQAGFDATAVPAPATEWFLPAGETTGSFEEQLVVLNPQSHPANVQVELRRQDGADAPPLRFTLGQTTQATIDVNPLAPDASVALHVTSDLPIVVERTSFFARPTGLGATDSTGVTR